MGIVKETEETQAQLRIRIAKWTVMWRSIILSSLHKTFYPYCLYIRMLDLRNLTELFNDPVFLNNTSDRSNKLYQNFFQGDMAQFEIRPAGKELRSKQRRRLDTVSILRHVGESITKCVGQAAAQHGATAALEELSGEITGDVLPTWCARLPRLKTMTLWDGNSLTEGVAEAIAKHCPIFSSFTLLYCPGEDADQHLGSFISALPPNSLTALEIIGSNDVHVQTFTALNTHQASLTSIKLSSLKSEAIRSLSLLKECTNIQTLELQGDVTAAIDLEATENDVFLEVIAWLKACKSLKELRLQKLMDSASIMKNVLFDDSIRLKMLEITGYNLVGNREFHQALANQTELESLDLRANAEESFRDDIDLLVASLSCLKNLKALYLLDTSDYFRTAQVQQLAFALPKVSYHPTPIQEIFLESSTDNVPARRLSRRRL
jgi:hypothetical protein